MFREEMTQIIQRAAGISEGQKSTPEAAGELAKRARLTPRIANRLLKRVRDFADVNGDGIIDTEIAHGALTLLEIDELGRSGRSPRTVGAYEQIRAAVQLA